jgi:microcystin-dependent protein
MSTPSIFRRLQALTDFYQANPLDFKLLDEEGKQALYILTSDGVRDAPGKTHHLFIANKSEQVVEIRASDSILPGPENHHFELRFRPGVLSAEHANWVLVGDRDWRSHARIWSGAASTELGIEEGTISIYLLFTIDEDPIQLRPGDTLLLPLENVKCDLAGGSRGSNVELRYHLTETRQIATQLAPEDQLRYLQEPIEIVNYYGIRDITLDATFLGSNSILNDGNEANHLSLQLTNTDRTEPIPLNGRNSENPTRLILYFDTSERPEAWALCDHDNALAIDVRLEMPRGKEVYWYIRQVTQGQSPRWVLTLEEDIPIDPGEHFFIHLGGIISAMPSGFSNLHLSYENIPGFWDGKFTVAIEKSPVKIQDTRNELGTIVETRVGIGTQNPKALLHVNGDMRASKLTLDGNISLREVESVSVGFTNKLSGVIIEDGTETETETVVVTAADGKVKARALEIDGFTVDKQGSALQLSGGQLTVQGKVHSGNSLSTDGSLTTGSFTLEEATDIRGKKHLQVKDNNAPTEVGGFVPKGAIMMWTGKNVPNGWALCNGEHGTPDLRSRFIVGAGQGTRQPGEVPAISLQNYLDGAVGGEETHQLTLSEMPTHNHSGNTDSRGRHQHWIEGNSAGGLAKRRRRIPGQTTVDMYYGGGSNADPNKEMWRGAVNTDYHGGHTHPFKTSMVGGNASHNNLPPYYALAFIMKL